MSISGKATRAAIVAVAVLASAFGMTQPAHAAPTADDEQVTVGVQAFLDSQGLHHTVRALTVQEIRERGLATPGAVLQVVAPRLVTDAAKAPTTATQAKSPAVALVQSCWNHSWWGGSTNLGGLWGQTDVTWCGSGGLVTYTWSNCWGHDGGYPTYEYLGCSVSETYGVNWTAWDVWSQHNLCFAWIPLWGACGSNVQPWMKFRYNAGGVVTQLGSS